jgi:hypothetical protein
VHAQANSKYQSMMYLRISMSKLPLKKEEISKEGINNSLFGLNPYKKLRTYFLYSQRKYDYMFIVYKLPLKPYLLMQKK